MTPLETRYDGYRFRSRLEARWAVFFNTLSVQYEYEKEGFDIGPAGCYLPDFWLPVQQCWVEIKHTRASGAELDKVVEFSLKNPDHVWLFKGLPNYDTDKDNLYLEYRVDASKFLFHPLPDGFAEWALSDPEEYGGIDSVRSAIARKGWTCQLKFTPFSPSGPVCCTDGDYRRAFQAARSARFGH